MVSELKEKTQHVVEDFSTGKKVLAFTRIYELHLQGMRAQKSTIPKPLRGSQPHFKVSGFPNKSLGYIAMTRLSIQISLDRTP